MLANMSSDRYNTDYYLTRGILRKRISRRQFIFSSSFFFFFLFFPEKQTLTFYANFSLEDNLHEISKPVFCENTIKNIYHQSVVC